MPEYLVCAEPHSSLVKRRTRCCCRRTLTTGADGPLGSLQPTKIVRGGGSKQRQKPLVSA